MMAPTDTDARERARHAYGWGGLSKGFCSWLCSLLALAFFATGAALAAGGMAAPALSGQCYRPSLGSVYSRTNFGGDTTFETTPASTDKGAGVVDVNLVLTPQGRPAVDPHNYLLNIDFRARGLGEAVPGAIGAVLLVACFCAVAFALLPWVSCCYLPDDGRASALQCANNVWLPTLVGALLLIAAGAAYLGNVVDPIRNSATYIAVNRECRNSLCSCYFDAGSAGLQISSAFVATLLGLPSLALALRCGRGWLFEPFSALREPEPARQEMARWTQNHLGVAEAADRRRAGVAEAADRRLAAAGVQRVEEPRPPCAPQRAPQHLERVDPTAGAAAAHALSAEPPPSAWQLRSEPLPSAWQLNVAPLAHPPPGMAPPLGLTLPPGMAPPPGIASRWPEAATASPVPADAAAASAAGLCVICLDAPATHLCVPCGHQCGCGRCLGLVRRSAGSCPICRSHVSSVVHVFVAGSA